MTSDKVQKGGRTRARLSGPKYYLGETGNSCRHIISIETKAEINLRPNRRKEERQLGWLLLSLLRTNPAVVPGSSHQHTSRPKHWGIPAHFQFYKASLELTGVIGNLRVAFLDPQSGPPFQ